ncbi:hypothetical protein [Aliiruegeria sabulilitoris]|uniref:hypothetical protein n=1 Tax=Aliiruegeria sabulilitoris TaxID=1510458 RepID=UPI000831427B|nr:hypothetical protein [Aliiruegeria sabulilitoris]NDR56537.1 hypothetical protein [Pseudoruegeria sp. M32A2M]
MDLETILGSKALTAVSVNGLLVPVDSLSKTLRSFSEPVLFYCKDFGEHGLSKSGSLFKTKFRGRYFGIISAHQIQKSSYSYQELVLSTDDKGNFVTSSMASFPLEDVDRSGDFDCLAFDFTEPVNAGVLPTTGWFNLSKDWDVGWPPKPDLVVAIGYPSHRNNIDYEKMHYPAGPNAVWGDATKPNISGRLAFKPDPPLDYNPEGMSGSPVFAISVNGMETKLFFAGIVTEAGSYMFHFFPFFRIRKLLSNLMEDSAI